MELSVLTRLKITAVLTLGIIVIGIMAWPLVRPSDSFGAVSSFGGDISFSDIVILASLAFLVGLAAYFLSWPYGREIGILAVPAGLCIWAARSADMAEILRQNPLVQQRQSVYSTLRWEGLFWLGIIAVGFAGVVLAGRIVPASPAETFESQAAGTGFKKNKYLYAVISVFGSMLIAQICIGVLARSATMSDVELGVVLGQPAVAQICFAVLVAFGFGAFLVKLLLNSNYIWPAIGTAVLNFLAMATAGRSSLVEQFVESWPPGFYTQAVFSILPLQLVAFGTLGSVIGFWLAIRYSYWKKHKVLSS